MADDLTIDVGGITYHALGQGDYDAIVFGLGFRECLISSLLLKKNKKVLIISKKQSFVWDNTSFDLLKIFNRFREEEPTEEDYESLGSNKDYHIDLLPKVITSFGSMAKLLERIDILDKLDLKYIDSHMAYNGSSKKIIRVTIPSSPEEASRSPLLSMMQRLHCRNLLLSVQEHTSKRERSHSEPSMNNTTKSQQNISMEEVYEKYGASESCQGIIGHGLALYENDDYLEEHAKITTSRIQEYMNSVTSDIPSPFLYPISGKQSLCEVFQSYLESFRNKCDIMLKQSSKQLVFENDHIAGVIVGDKAARAPVVIGDSTWFRDDRQKKIGKVARSICLLNHPIEGCDTGKSEVIGFFRKQLVKAGYKPRESDISLLCLSWNMKVCPKGIYIAVLSAPVETQKAEKELKVVFDMLGPVLERFDSITTMYRPKKSTKQQGIFIFRSPDASATMDAVADDISDIFSDIINGFKNHGVI